MSIDVTVSGLNTEVDVFIESNSIRADIVDDSEVIVTMPDLRPIAVNVPQREPITPTYGEYRYISGGATSYEELEDKPQIEGVTLIGNKTYEELNLQRISNSDIEDLLIL